MAKSISKSHVRVESAEFEFSHGHSPRGTGSWAFRFGSSRAEPTWIPGSLTFSAARKIAVAQAAGLGVDTLFVCT